LNGSVQGALVPHAPVLLPEVVGHGVAAETEDIRNALTTVSFDDVDLVVVLSPHARATGVYESVAGDLDDFGISGIELERSSDPDAVEMLATSWNQTVLREPIDHGVLVPLKLLATRTTPVVAAGLAGTDEEATSPDEAIAAGLAFADAIAELSRDRSMCMVVSGQTSCALTPRAPLTERAEAKPVEANVVGALGGDPSALGGSVRDLWRLGGSCSPGTLASYGRVFAGRRSEVLAYAYPFGVGYVVARVT
jgi:aromatic ring-opening dioxygenase LigB subunit